MLEASNNNELPVIPGKRYFTIGEVAELCDVKPHVLRYWEQEFPQLKPVKRRGNRRYYQRHDVLLIRQYRHAAGGSILEVPAGKLDPGDTPEICAARELEEEGGYRAGRLEKLGWIFTTPGFTDEIIHLFAAFDLERIATRHEDDEVIELVHTSLAEALDWIWRGQLTDAKSAMALLHAARFVGRLS